MGTEMSMIEAVKAFVEKYDNVSPIYDHGDAMEILENSEEDFVNLVIDSVDKGYRIGDSLINFEYDEKADLWRKK